MQRLLTAIENPYTTILGHMTGRLLLAVKDILLIIKDHRCCAANHVVIELNAHPSRLDIDWRHIDYALEKNVMLSIDPMHTRSKDSTIPAMVCLQHKSNGDQRAKPEQYGVAGV